MSQILFSVFPRQSLDSSWAGSGLGPGGRDLTLLSVPSVSEMVAGVSASDPHQCCELGKLRPTLQMRKLRLHITTH